MFLDGPPVTSLSWVRLPGAELCIDARALAEAVEHRLGRPALAAPSRADRTIEGRIEKAGDGPGFRASLALTGDSGAVLGTREISSDAADCRAMDGDLALVIALMIDPDSALASVPVPAASLPAGATPLPVSPPAPLVTSSPPPSPPPGSPGFRFALRGGPTFSVGLLPSAGAGGAMSLTILPPRPFPFEIGAVLWAPQRAASPSGEYGADIWVAFGGISACPLAGETRGFFLAACAGVQVGAAHVGGFGFEKSLARDVALVSLTAGAHARRTFAGPVFGALGLGLAVPLVGLDVYHLEGTERREVFYAPPLAGTLDVALGVELR